MRIIYSSIGLSINHYSNKATLNYSPSTFAISPSLITSVNPVHNAPVEQKKKKKGSGSLTDTENKIHQKKKKGRSG
jgi:hypothetical protein